MTEVVHKRAGAIAADIEKLMALPMCTQVQWVRSACGFKGRHTLQAMLHAAQPSGLAFVQACSRFCC